MTLQKPICFFDIESTGKNIIQDRIIEISILKIFQNQKKESKTWLINPQIPICDEASQIHGFRDEDVKKYPVFKEYAKEIKSFLVGSDIGGFNILRFDLPMLAEEFSRVGIDFDFEKCRYVDVQNIFHKMEQRTLVAAYKFYCNKDLTNAHSALADTEATYEVLLAQIEKYEELEDNVDFLSDFSQPKHKVADFEGRIIYNEDEDLALNFGKFKGTLLVDLIKNNPSYIDWILKSEFSIYTKKIIRDLQLKLLVNIKK